MRLFKKIITSPEVEQAYNQFMLNFEVQALRMTGYLGIFYLFLFLIIDYWRVENYYYTLIFRSGAILTTLIIILLSHRKEVTPSYYNLLCLLLSSALPILFYLLDLKAGMPLFFLPNAICLFFYVFNACLGHTFKLKAIHTGIFFISFILYSFYLSPYKSSHLSQVWNLSLNASMSLLIGYLIVWFKRVRYVQQEQLIESNAKLDLALRSAEMGIWSWDIKTGQRKFDEKILDLLGIDSKTFKGTSEEFYNAVHPDDRQMLQKQIAEALETKNVISPEYRAVWQDGSTHYIKARAKVISDALGSPLKLKGISWDITDQKKVESKLKQLSLVAEKTTNGIVITNARGAVIWANQSYLDLTESSLDQILNRRPRDVFNRNDKSLLGEIEKINATDFTKEFEFTTLKGNKKWVRLNNTVVKDDNGEILQQVEVLIDITERIKSEQILVESEQKFRQISETINDVFYLYNIVDKKYEFISKNCEEILGAPPEFFYSGKKYNKTFVVEEDQQKMMKANELVDAGTPYEVDYRILNKGEIKWIREKSFPIKDELGKAVKNSGTCTDITHLKLQEIQLLAQTRHLEALNNTKDKFFSIVAHDLKSPLNSLKGFTSLLIDHSDRLSKEEIIKASKQTQLAVDNTIKMADNLITWARLQMNDYETRQEKIYFIETVATILPVYKRIAEKKGITFNWSFEDTVTLFADKNHIQFIVRNLLNNAIKFTNREGSIKLSATTSANGETQISVSDNGIGIPDEKKKKIFFIGKNQSSNGTAGEKGTGLGLMLCHEFTKLNGGAIEVESQVGQGTIFNVRLKSDSD